jgi:4-hydroxy-tetrahydrodipicolinate reductase
MSVPLKIVVFGALGRMGQEVRFLAKGDPSFECMDGIDKKDALLDQKPPHHVLPLEEGPLEAVDVVIDFSHPDGLLDLLGVLLKKPIPLVSGTTGLQEDHKRKLKELSGFVPVVWASNFSKLAHILFFLASKAAEFSADEDFEILEAHHKGKKDAPSGTALSLFEALSKIRPGLIPVFSRVGDQAIRSVSDVGILALRGGDVVGDHTLYCFGEGERLELTHRAHSRRAFAKGALLAACWVHGRPPGLYTMAQVLGIKA